MREKKRTYVLKSMGTGKGKGKGNWRGGGWRWELRGERRRVGVGGSWEG